MPPSNSPHAPKTLLVTQALPYANGDIHIGHLVEAVQTDIFVRFHKLIGNKVLFAGADDTHGTPIELSALKQGITPEALIAQVKKNHEEDYAKFSIGFDIFHSTNSPENKRWAEYIYQSLINDDLVISKEITQYFCEHDKRFLPDRFVTGICPKCASADQYGDSCDKCGTTYDPTELGDPRCIICKNPPVLKTSTHLFVQLEKRKEFLKKFVQEGSTLGSEMRNFVGRWIDDGLREWCISRDGPYFGFPIPGKPNKFFYVWLDAPIGYISSTDAWCESNGENVDTYWRNNNAEIVHFIGKDIVYFHALFWPVMLNSGKLNIPSRIFVHGFLTVNGEKMSKSKGTFIRARDFAEKVVHSQATQFLRFYFAGKLDSGVGDLDLSIDEFCLRVNTILGNNIGNLCNRTMVFCERYFDKRVPDAPWNAELALEAARIGNELYKDFGEAQYKLAIEKIQAFGSLGNKYFQDNEPWKLIKENKEKAAEIMVTCINVIKCLGVFLKPIVPEIAASIERQLQCTFSWNDHLFSLRNAPLAAPEKLIVPIETSAFTALFPAPQEIPVLNVQPAILPVSTDLIDITDFKKIDLRIATILAAEPVKKSNKLLKLKVSIGTEERQIIAGIGQHYKPEALIGQHVVVIANLKPATLMGETSQGMILAAGLNGKLSLIAPLTETPAGSKVS